MVLGVSSGFICACSAVQGAVDKIDSMLSIGFKSIIAAPPHMVSPGSQEMVSFAAADSATMHEDDGGADANDDRAADVTCETPYYIVHVLPSPPLRRNQSEDEAAASSGESSF